MLYLEDFIGMLEPFRHSEFHSLYIVTDQSLAKSIVNKPPKPYGLEIGFGDQPVGVFNLDSTLPWILTEPDARAFRVFQKEIGTYWNYADKRLLQSVPPIIAMQHYATDPLQAGAQVLVYRNPNYGDMDIIRRSQLRRGQRMVLIVDEGLGELPRYKDFLVENGYNPDQLLPRSEHSPKLTFPFRFAPEDYVFDYTKE